MNPKLARRLFLSYYALTLSLFLALATLSASITQSSLIAFALTLPLPLYFALQSRKLTAKYLRLRSLQSPLTDNRSSLEDTFSFGKFIFQPSLTFRLSLLLLCVISFTTLARLR